MMDRDLLAAKLSELAHRVSRVRARCPHGAAELKADRDALELVAFNLMLAVQTCANVASHLIADSGWPPGKTLRESFERLDERGVIDAPTAAALSRAVGLRNVIAHGYAAIDPTMVHRAATTGLADLEAFASQVAAWAVAAGSGGLAGGDARSFRGKE